MRNIFNTPPTTLNNKRNMAEKSQPIKTTKKIFHFVKRVQ